MNDQHTREHAERRVEKKIGFYVHAIVFVAVMSLLAGLNLARNPQNLWFLWPLFGWGIGLLFHGLSVFVFRNHHPSFKERMIEREMKR
jgi:hypothetical protein